MNSTDEKISIIIVGESSVGKTSLLNQYTKGIFSTQLMATAGLEYFSKDEIIDGKKVKVKIWDTAGQEQYKSLTRNFYRNSNGVVIVYDVTSRKTFNTVKDWISSINDAADKDIKIILVGNKIDLPREVTNEEGRNMAQKFNIKFFETSAKDNIGITESIKDIALMVLNSNKKNSGGLDIVTHPENSRSCKC